MSGAAQRRKGVVGEREAAEYFRLAGWELRGLEGSGDWLAFRQHLHESPVFDTHTLHVEVKRQERLRLPEWLAQARAEAPTGVAPVVVFRQNRGEWYACLPLGRLLTLIG
jgi:hypothetical protein